MKIDASSHDLVCIQVQQSERTVLLDVMRNLGKQSGSEALLPCDNGVVILRLVPSGIAINCSDRSAIQIELSKSECDYLADAIAEHLADEGGLPLDHSFESLGAVIVPSEVKDLVIETIVE